MRKLVLAAAAIAIAACTPPAATNTAAQTTTTEALPAHAMVPANLPAFFACLGDKSQAIVEAHRGGNEPGYAENSVETFAHTLSQEPAFMEIDIGKTKDG